MRKRVVDDIAFRRDKPSNRLIDDAHGIVYWRLAGTKPGGWRICTCRLKDGRWSVWSKGHDVLHGDEYEERHLHALAYVTLAGPDGFPPYEFDL